MKFLPRPQRTIKAPIAVEGFGYWSGKDIRVEFRPADPGTGLTFFRDDLDGCPQIPVTYKNRVEAHHRTCLALPTASDISVGMVEHVLAALAGMWVDNCEIHVTEEEMPGMDGSASAFVSALESVGFVRQGTAVKEHRVNRTIRLEDGQRWIEIAPAPHGVLTLAYNLDYAKCPSIGHQRREIEITPENFKREIAPARTFVTLEDVEVLRKSGLAHRATEKDLLVFDEHGVIGNELRFKDECVRHKLLDLVGDLCLSGGTWNASFLGFRSGHDLNFRFMRQLMQQEEFVPAIHGEPVMEQKPIIAAVG